MTSAPAAAPSRWPLYAAWAAIVILYVAIRAQLLEIPLDRDEGTFGYAGQSILRGELPYRDFFDHKPPGLFYLYALVMLLVPPTAAGLHTFLHVWNFLALLALAYVAWKLAGHAAALGTAFVYSVISAAPSVQGFTASAEMTALAPLAASLALVAAAARRDDRWRDVLMLIAGLLAAFAFLIKPPYALPLLATPLLARAEGGARWKRDTIVWLVGGVIVGALVAVVFAGVWKEFWYWNATHNSVYRDQSWDGWTGRLSYGLKELTPDVGVPFILAIIGCAWAFLKRQRYAPFLTAFLVLSAVSCFQAGYMYTHYFAQLVAALALAAGVGAAASVNALSQSVTVRRAAAVVLALLVIAIPAMAKPWYWITPNAIEVSLRALGPQAFEASPLIAEHLRERTRPSDTVLIYANEPQLAFMAERRNANPFVMMYPMTLRFPRQSEFQRRTWEAMKAANPAYIVVAREPALMPRWPDTDPYLDRQIETLRGAYPLESCLSLVPGEGLVLNTQLGNTGQPCPGQPIFEIWRRR